MSDKNVVYTGKRKTAICRVVVKPGTGKITVNKMDGAIYFGRRSLFEHGIAPLKALDADDKYDVQANIRGGGLSGQSGALRLAVARALAGANPESRKTLKPAGMLTRDARIVERKKPGLHKARKATQFSKR